MKVYSFLLIIVFSLTTNIFAQVEFISHTITTSLDNAFSVYSVDIDSDGDMDVLSASSGQNPLSNSEIAWYENDGNENFTSHIITTSAINVTSVYAVDVDGDGDMDVLSASWVYSKIAWYENLSPVGIDDLNPPVLDDFILYQNYPNPFNPSTIIKYAIGSLPTGQASKQYASLKVYNVLGNEIATLVNEDKPAGSYEVDFDASSLPTGVYFYQLHAANFSETKKMVLLR